MGGILPNWGFSKHGEFNPALVSQKQNACRDIPASRLAVRWFATHLLLRVKRKDSRLPKLGTEVLVLKRLQTVSFGTEVLHGSPYSREQFFIEAGRTKTLIYEAFGSTVGAGIRRVSGGLHCENRIQDPVTGVKR